MAQKQYQYGNSKVKIQWVNQGFKDILNSEDLAEICDDAAEKIAHRAGEHFEAKRWYSHGIGKGKPGRVASIVRNKDKEGAEEEATNKTLTKAVNSCGTL